MRIHTKKREYDLSVLNKPIKDHSKWLYLSILILLVVVWYNVPPMLVKEYRTVPQIIHDPIIEQFDPAELANVELTNTHLYKVTGFSSVECHTTWCNAHRGEPRGSQVALNAKYGSYSQVYLPKYDKTYDVIGTTDEFTDLDIWFGDDQEAAFEFGAQYLDVTLIK